MQTETYWVGERKFLALTVLDVSTDPATPVTDYSAAAVAIGTPITAATWTPAVDYDGKRGMWVDGLSSGTYGVLAKAGGGSPDEVDIVPLGFVIIRSR